MSRLRYAATLEAFLATELPANRPRGRSAITRSAFIKSLIIVDCIRSLPCLLAVLTVNCEALAAGVMMLLNTSAKNPAECFASRSTKGMMTKAFRVEAPSASARVTVSGLPASEDETSSFEASPEGARSSVRWSSLRLGWVWSRGSLNGPQSHRTREKYL
jgi:hypothetical protein